MEKEKKKAINRCVKQIKKGNGETFVPELHALIGNNVRFISFKFFGRSPVGDDAVQAFWENVEKICLKCPVVEDGGAYLLRSFNNMCKNQYKSLTAHPPVLDIGEFETEIATDEEITFRQVALKNAFNKAKEKMSHREKEVFLRILYGNEPIVDIAKEIGISRRHATRLKQSAIEKLKITLIEEGWLKNDE